MVQVERNEITYPVPKRKRYFNRTLGLVGFLVLVGVEHILAVLGYGLCGGPNEDILLVPVGEWGFAETKYVEGDWIVIEKKCLFFQNVERIYDP